ncbi:MAG: ABC transporter permease, partial [Pseudomonadota bacterium]
MLRQIVHRLLLSIPVLLGVLALGFFLLQLVPGDPAVVIAGPMAPQSVIEEIRRDMGLDQPVVVQFVLYLGRVLQGDLGHSMINNIAVTEELVRAGGPTVELMFAALFWSIPLGIAMGTVAAVNRGRLVDRAVMAFSVAGVSMPIFFIALMLMQYLGFKWQLLPLQ